MGDKAAPTLLVGNRMVLVGATLYLLEWVAIFAAGLEAPLGAEASTSDLLAAYSGHQESLGWVGGWLSVVLLGRVLITTGLRTAFADSGRPQPLMDLAVAAMAVGVTLEIATYAMTSGASWLFAHGGTVDQVRILDAAGYDLNGLLWGPTGVAVLCCGIAMWRSRIFTRALTGLALAAGGVLTVMGAALLSPRFVDLFNVLAAGAALFWIWMIWTGILLWRRAPSPRTAGTPSS